MFSSTLTTVRNVWPYHTDRQLQQRNKAGRHCHKCQILLQGGAHPPTSCLPFFSRCLSSEALAAGGWCLCLWLKAASISATASTLARVQCVTCGQRKACRCLSQLSISNVDVHTYIISWRSPTWRRRMLAHQWRKVKSGREGRTVSQARRAEVTNGEAGRRAQSLRVARRREANLLLIQQTQNAAASPISVAHNEWLNVALWQ